jgi:hypothetical protein
MTKNILLIAGIFIACVLLAGIPAVSAADNTMKQVVVPAPITQPTALSAITPASLSTPADPVISNQQAEPSPQATEMQAAQPATEKPTNATAGENANQNTDQKTWWEKLWPFQNTATQTQTQQVTSTTAPVTTVPTQDAEAKPQVQHDHLAGQPSNATGTPQQGTVGNQQGVTNQKVTSGTVQAHKSV